MWQGAAAICINQNKRLLMVRQGKPDEEKKWSVPSGQKEDSESFEACCVREVWEETGYRVKVVKHIHEKLGESYGIQVKVHYYLVDIIGGAAEIHDPDGLIYEIAWKTSEEIESLILTFPEDRAFLIRLLNDYLGGNDVIY